MPGAVLAVVVLIALIQLAGLLQIVHSSNQPWGVDFRGGQWAAAQAVLRGQSPYAAPRASLLRELATPYVWPPLLASITIPLAHLPFTVAIALWNCACAAGLIGGLWILGVRDWRLFALAVFSAPFVESLYFGQPEGLFVLLLALAWRWRDSPYAGVAAGFLIAAKLFAWPLVIWLAVTGRRRSAGIAIASALGLLVASWALIDFNGLSQYPRLLSADTRAFGDNHNAMAVYGITMHLSASRTVATALGIVVGIGVGLLAVLCAGGSDEGWFSGAVITGLLVSPLLWTHYLLVLFVPLAISRRRWTGLWLVTSVLWVWIAGESYALRAAVTLVAAVIVAVGAAARKPHAQVSAARTPI
jgi:hypothetical protein